MVLMKMRDDDRLYLLRFHTQFTEQSRRLEEIFSFCPFRRDIVGMESGIDDYGALGSVSEPENISNRFVPVLNRCAHTA